MKRLSLRRVSRKRKKVFDLFETFSGSTDVSSSEPDLTVVTSDDQPSDDTSSQSKSSQKLSRTRQTSSRRKQFRKYIEAMSPINKRKDSFAKLAEETRDTLGAGLLQLEELVTDEETGTLRVRSEVEDSVDSEAGGGQVQSRLGSPTYIVSQSEEFGFVSREVSASHPHNRTGRVMVKAHSIDTAKPPFAATSDRKESTAINGRGEKEMERKLRRGNPLRKAKLVRLYKSEELPKHATRFETTPPKDDVIRSPDDVFKEERNASKPPSGSPVLSPGSQETQARRNRLFLMRNHQHLNKPVSEGGVGRMYRSQETLPLAAVKNELFSKSTNDITHDVENFPPLQKAGFVSRYRDKENLQPKHDCDSLLQETHFGSVEEPTMLSPHSPIPIEVVVQINKEMEAQSPKTSKNSNEKEKPLQEYQQVEDESKKLVQQPPQRERKSKPLRKAKIVRSYNPAMLSPEKIFKADYSLDANNKLVDVTIDDDVSDHVNAAHTSQSTEQYKGPAKMNLLAKESLKFMLEEDAADKSPHSSQQSLFSPVRQKLHSLINQPKRSPKLSKKDILPISRSASALTDTNSRKKRIKRRRKTLENTQRLESTDDNVFESSLSADEILLPPRPNTRIWATPDPSPARQQKNPKRLSQAFTSFFKSPSHSKPKVLELNLDLVLEKEKEVEKKCIVITYNDDVDKTAAERSARMAEIEDEKRKHEEVLMRLEEEAHNIRMTEEANTEIIKVEETNKEERVELTIRGAFVVHSDSEEESKASSKTMMKVRRRFSSIRSRSEHRKSNLGNSSTKKKGSKVRRAVSLRTDRNTTGKRDTRSPKKILEDLLASEKELNTSRKNTKMDASLSNNQGGWLAITQSPTRTKPSQTTVYTQKSQGSKYLVKQLSFHPFDESSRITAESQNQTLSHKNDEISTKKKIKPTKRARKKLKNRKGGVSAPDIPAGRMFGRDSIVASDWEKVTDFGGMPARKVFSDGDADDPAREVNAPPVTRTRSASQLSGSNDIKRDNSEVKRNVDKTKTPKQENLTNRANSSTNGTNASEARNMTEEKSVSLVTASSENRKKKSDVGWDQPRKSEASSDSFSDSSGSNVSVIEIKNRDYNTQNKKKETIFVKQNATSKNSYEDKNEKNHKTPSSSLESIRTTDTFIIKETGDEKPKDAASHTLNVPQIAEASKQDENKARSPAKVISGLFHKIIHTSQGKESNTTKQRESTSKQNHDDSSKNAPDIAEKRKSNKNNRGNSEALLVPRTDNEFSSLQNLASLDSPPNKEMKQHDDVRTSGDVTRDRQESSNRPKLTKQTSAGVSNLAVQKEAAESVVMKQESPTHTDQLSQKQNNHEKKNVPLGLVNAGQNSITSQGEVENNSSQFAPVPIVNVISQTSSTNRDNAFSRDNFNRRKSQDKMGFRSPYDILEQRKTDGDKIISAEVPDVLLHEATHKSKDSHLHATTQPETIPDKQDEGQMFSRKKTDTFSNKDNLKENESKSNKKIQEQNSIKLVETQHRNNKAFGNYEHKPYEQSQTESSPKANDFNSHETGSATTNEFQIPPYVSYMPAHMSVSARRAAASNKTTPLGRAGYNELRNRKWSPSKPPRNVTPHKSPKRVSFNPLVSEQDPDIPMTSNVRVINSRKAHKVSRTSYDYTAKQSESINNNFSTNQFDYEDYFDDKKVPVESRIEYVTKNWKDLYDVPNREVKNTALSPRTVKQMNDKQQMLMRLMLMGNDDVPGSDDDRLDNEASQRRTSVEHALADLLYGMRMSNEVTFVEKRPPAKYEKLMKIQHGQCSLSVPYITLDKPEVSFLNERPEIYASDSSSECVDVYSPEGKHKSSFPVTGCPRGLTTYAPGHVLCTSCTTGQVYAIDMVRGNIIRKISHSKNSRNPRYVTMHHGNQTFMTSDIRYLGNWNINMFDLRTGALSLSIAPSNHTDIRVKWPGFLNFRPATDQLYVSDSESNCLFVYDVRGATRPVFQIGEEGEGDGELYNPCGVTYISEGFLAPNSALGGSVVVSDWGNNRISAFDAITGQFECHLINNGGLHFREKIVETPYDISSDEKGWIYVTESETNHIKVFKPI